MSYERFDPAFDRDLRQC